MSEAILPIPTTAQLPEPCPGSSTGEGAQTALAAMIRKRRMGENHVEPEQVEPLPDQLPPP